MPSGSRTDVGRVRARNEDALIVDDDLGLYAVLDGLGGHPAGDVASSVASAALREHLMGDRVAAADPFAALTEGLLEAHSRVLADAGEHPERTHMGTTVVLALVREGRAWIAHVGDSRAYLLREGKSEPLTDDHGYGGMLTQALGIVDDPQPDLREVELGEGRLLLCTDGLTRHISDEGLADIGSGARDVQQAAEDLVDAALSAGGVDNITVVVVEE